MEKITLKIDGMMCGMCEAHINDTIRNVYPKAKKVKATRKNGEASFILDETFDEEKMKDAIAQTGYTYVSSKVEPYEKHGIFG